MKKLNTIIVNEWTTNYELEIILFPVPKMILEFWWTYRKQNVFLWQQIRWRICLFLNIFGWGAFIRNNPVRRVYSHWPWSNPCPKRDRIILFFKAIDFHVICNKPRFDRFYRISYQNWRFHDSTWTWSFQLQSRAPQDVAVLDLWSSCSRP